MTFLTCEVGVIRWTRDRSLRSSMNSIAARTGVISTPRLLRILAASPAFAEKPEQNVFLCLCTSDMRVGPPPAPRSEPSSRSP